jgi:hypothetical protein
MTKERFPERDERHALLMYVNNTVVGAGMTRNEYESIKNRLVAPFWTVKELILSEISIDEVKWEGNKLVFVEQK